MGDERAERREAEGFDWRGAEDLTVLSEAELRARLGELAEEEREAGYRLRVLQGRMDVIRAELVRRGEAALAPEELARVLLGEGPLGRGS
jgi:hypothetical protein